MGGMNEEKISGLRLHMNNGNIHIHDDLKNLKFEMQLSEFKNEIDDAFEELKKSDGIYKIDGKKDSLCLMKSNNMISMFVKDKSGIKQKLQSFLRKC